MAWSIVLIEPTIRFWLAGRGRSRVQRMRLRSLSLSFALVVLTRVAIVLARTGTSQIASVIENSIALLLLPLLFVTLVPPAWLRRAWRREEDQERALTRRLVMFAPDRGVLAARALEWATRLVGSSGGFILDVEGRVLATDNVRERQAD